MILDVILGFLIYNSHTIYNMKHFNIFSYCDKSQNRLYCVYTVYIDYIHAWSYHITLETIVWNMILRFILNRLPHFRVRDYSAIGLLLNNIHCSGSLNTLKIYVVLCSHNFPNRWTYVIVLTTKTSEAVRHFKWRMLDN